jgi:beta-lactamase superfamily II metal-dependent hydrolase
MQLSLDVMRARKGDCLMLHYGSKNDPHLVMIDGGPSNVYKPHLRPRIEQIRKARQLDDQASLPVDVLMISHVDDDHIKGILDLTKELRVQKDDQEPLLIRVGSLWHNSFDDLLGSTPEELAAQAGFGAAALAGTIEVGDDVELDAAMVLASIPQGRDLRNDAEFLKWKRNDKFKGKLILATKASKPVLLDGGLKFTVIGPMQPELQALQDEHDKWLRKQKKQQPSDAALAAFVDKSIPNLSSIVVLAEAQGKRILLTGDARGDKVLEGLRLAGLLAAGNRSTMHVDVLKVPHHGSANNLETKFFERVTADHYVFSGNGEHGNPERETLSMLLEARGDAPFVMHFTYPIGEIDVERRKDWEKEQAKEKKRKKKKVRPSWSHDQHSLSAFFEHKGLAHGQKMSFVDADKPHVIDLLDELGF